MRICSEIRRCGVEAGAPRVPERGSTGAVASNNEGVRVFHDRPCYLCGRPGRPAWSHLRDRLYSAPGEWRMLECRRCDFLWLDPQPLSRISGCCTRAIARMPAQKRSRVGDGSNRGSVRTSLVTTATVHLPKGPGRSGICCQGCRTSSAAWSTGCHSSRMERLLDVGCGNGELMRRMRGFGWDVMGVEPDRAAADVARREYGLDVRASVNEAPRASFDAVITHHVIEHVPDPVGFLESLASVCRPNARIVVVTPNARGLGARWFGASYVHLDPPRHVMLFSAASLTEVAQRAGLEVERLRTSARYARFAWSGSRSIATSRHGRGERGKPGGLRRVNSVAFQVAEHVLGTVWPTSGEELILVARPRRVR